MTKTKSTYLALLAVLLSPMAAHAGPIALDIRFEGAIELASDDRTWGWEFSVTTAFAVDSLGAWDQDADGLNVAQNVSIWTSAGVLLSSMLVDNTATGVTPGFQAGADEGQWLQQDVVDFVLGIGDYVIGIDRVGGSGDAFHGSDTVVITDTRVTYTGIRSSDVDLFAFPDNSLAADPGAASYFGPTFWIADGVSDPMPVPEPGSLALFGMGVAGMGLMRRRRQV